MSDEKVFIVWIVRSAKIRKEDSIKSTPWEGKMSRDGKEGGGCGNEKQVFQSQ